MDFIEAAANTRAMCRECGAAIRLGKLGKFGLSVDNIALTNQSGQQHGERPCHELPPWER